MNHTLRTLPLAALLGLALLAGCDPKSPKVTADDRPSTGTEQATGSITGSAGTATGTGGAGSTTTPGTPSGSLPEASGPAVSAGNEPTAGGSTGAPLGAGAATPPSVAVPASSTASMAAGANDRADRTAAPNDRSQAAPGGDAPAKAGTDGLTRLSSAERTFVQNAAGLGLYEIAAAQLGQDRAKDPAVRNFAAHMQRDHVKAQGELQKLADQHHVDLPGQMPPDRLTVLERLQRAEPFDTAFVNTVGVQDHVSVIERFEKAAHDAKDPALQGWIKQTLPALREHLSQARKLPGADSR
jgi:putative membrane protein